MTFRVKVDTSCSALEEPSKAGFYRRGFGDDVYVVGNDVELGAWKPNMAARLRTHEEAYPVPRPCRR